MKRLIQEVIITSINCDSVERHVLKEQFVPDYKLSCDILCYDILLGLNMNLHPKIFDFVLTHLRSDIEQIWYSECLLQ